MKKIHNKNIMIYGTGISGIAAIKALYKLGNKIYVYDDNKSKEEVEKINDLKKSKYNYIGKISKNLIKKIDIVVKSPSIPFYNSVLERFESFKIPIYSDVEMAYRITDKDFVAVTGTNGKTTTTTLVCNILRDAEKKVGITGNIGSGILEDVLNDKYKLFVVEASSYQLNSVYKFKPKVSIITNITPDHLNWHKTMENYIESKLNILKNQNKNDYAVLNYDDHNIKKNLNKAKANILFFSTKRILEEGLFLENNKIFFKTKGNKKEIIDVDNLKLLGEHNLENIMASAGAALVLNIPIDKIRKTISKFTGVEHRLEKVKSSIDTVSFYNDSKGTNPESTIKAVNALEENIIIILGGYNKDSSFDELISNFDGKVKYVLIIGETKYNIKKSLDKIGFNKYKLVNSLEEAVFEAYRNSNKRDKILLSPACASWDMYKSFEERGNHFKKIIKKLEKDV